jgi:hypothetical protein
MIAPSRAALRPQLRAKPTIAGRARIARILPAQTHRSRDIVSAALVDAVFVDHLEQLMIVAIVHMDSDDHRSLRVKGLLHDRNDVVGLGRIAGQHSQRHFWRARKPVTHLFSTEAWFKSALVGVDCERELTREP